LQPPQKYQPLRDEHARVAKESASKAEKQEAPSPALDAEQEPGPTRPTEIRSPGWTADPRMDRQQESAARYHNWLNQNHANRDAAQQLPMQQLEKQSGKDLPAADLAEAKEQKPRTMEEFLERERQQRDIAKEKVAQSIGASEATPEQETQQEHSRDGGQSL
jgi:hypothetical protein